MKQVTSIYMSRDPGTAATERRPKSTKMGLLFRQRELVEFLVLVIFVVFISEGKKLFTEEDGSSSQDSENKSTFITVRVPAHLARHKKDCFYEGKVHRHGDAWSPGPCIPECRCKHGHVKCSKLECPDLNCETSIKKKWKCCPECLPEMQNGTSCGVWTKGGNANGGCCVFPFNYRGVKYFTCTYQDHDNPWCSVSSEFDRDGVWGECIDKGEAINALKFNRNKGKKAGYGILDQDIDGDIANIANQAANNVTSEALQNETNPSSTAPVSSVAAPASGVSVPASSVAAPASSAAAPISSVAVPASSVAASASSVTVPTSNATVPTSNATQSVPIQPAATGSPAVQSQSSNLTVSAISPAVVPSPTSTQPPATTAVTLPAQSYTLAPSPSAGVSVVPQVSPAVVQPGAGGSVVQMTPGLVAPASQPAVLPGPSVVPAQPGVVGTTASVEITYPVVQPVVPAQPGVVGTTASVGITYPVVQPVVPAQTGVVGTTASVGITYPVVQPVVPAQTGAVATPSVEITYPAGGTPPLGPQPVPQPSEGAQPTQPSVEGATGWFPATQTIIDPGQTQVPGQAAGQAVHQLTTTEINENHNISTTESWFGLANETLNRTNEVPAAAEMNQIAGVAAGSEAVSYSSNNQPSNQASYGYQAASSANEYQGQNPAAYMDQRSDSRESYYNAPGYNAYYNNVADQQYGASQAQYGTGQESYYSNQQQYQNAQDQGSYYSG